MISYEEALAAIGGIDLALPVEQVPLAAAASRVLAASVAMSRDQPPFDRATMDGYAMLPQPGVSEYRVAGMLAAGATATAPGPGEALRVMTGAPVPAGCTVVPLEATDRGRDAVRILDAKALAPGRNVAWRGEDARAGALVLASGTRLAPPSLAAAAMAGASDVALYRTPRLAVLVTGDEVGTGGAAGIADCNGPLLASIAASLGLPCRMAQVPDRPDAVATALSAALAEADLVITTGGVGPGERDLLPAAAAALGCAVLFHGVDIQPGKPALLARRGRAVLLGLPGNPVSVLATAHLYLPPLLERFWPGFRLPWLDLPLAAPARGKARRLFLPARLADGGVRPVAWNGSGDLLAAAHGDGLVDLAPGCALEPGARVRFLPWIGGSIGAGARWPR